MSSNTFTVDIFATSSYLTSTAVYVPLETSVPLITTRSPLNTSSVIACSSNDEEFITNLLSFRYSGSFIFLFKYSISILDYVIVRDSF